jgi:hypothetical protein
LKKNFSLPLPIPLNKTSSFFKFIKTPTSTKKNPLRDAMSYSSLWVCFSFHSFAFVLLNLIHLDLFPDLVTNYMKQSNVSKHATSNISKQKEKASPPQLTRISSTSQIENKFEFKTAWESWTPQVKKPLMSATRTDVLIRLINCSVFSFQWAYNQVAAACLLIQTLSYLCIMGWWMTSNGLNWILVKLGPKQIG